MAEEKPIFELCNKKGVPGIEGATKERRELWGKYVCSGPSGEPGFEDKSNSYSKLNFTGQPGTASGMYYSLVFSLVKQGWTVQKADEWIEVSPTHKEYYDRTVSTKQMLESTIKQGLISAAQTAADYELMSHDVRKYKEILGYIENNDDNLLKSMFIDQVDIHTDLPGQPIALRSIASRWPTIIADFMGLNENDKEANKIADYYKISIAEAIILSTKNKLFLQWKKMFSETAKERYKMLRGLAASRQKTVSEYKEWLKPYITRFRMTRIGNERAFNRSQSLRTFVDITGQQTFANQIRLFVWKPMKFAEHKKPLTEIRPTRGIHEGFAIEPYDDYVRNEIILNGLANIYPWLNKDVKYCPNKKNKDCKTWYSSNTEKCPVCDITLQSKKYVDQIVEKEIIPNWKLEMGLDPTEPYYMFIDINVFRDGSRLQVGELEDITFTNKMYVLSQNIMLVKILELWCRDRELENYIDEMLGMRSDDMSIGELVEDEIKNLKETPIEKKKAELQKSMNEYGKAFQDFKGFYSKNFAFMKGGPYERDLKDRLTKQYFKFASVQLGAITAFLKAKMGVE